MVFALLSKWHPPALIYRSITVRRSTSHSHILDTVLPCPTASGGQPNLYQWSAAAGPAGPGRLRRREVHTLLTAEAVAPNPCATRQDLLFNSRVLPDWWFILAPIQRHYFTFARSPRSLGRRGTKRRCFVSQNA